MRTIKFNDPLLLEFLTLLGYELWRVDDMGTFEIADADVPALLNVVDSSPAFDRSGFELDVDIDI